MRQLTSSVFSLLMIRPEDLNQLQGFICKITRLPPNPALFCVIGLASHCAKGEAEEHTNTHTHIHTCRHTIILHCGLSLWTPVQ